MGTIPRPPSEGDTPPKGGQAETTAHHAPRISSPFQRVFAPHALVWSEASRLSRRKDIKVSDLALCALQDPAIVLELLRKANALYFSAGRPPITNAVTAITRLGSEVVAELLTDIAQREPIEDLEVRRIFELHRNRCKRAGILAHMLAEVVAKPLADECHTAGLLLFVGDMLAVQHLGTPYVKLYNTQNFITVQCKLAQEHKFDPEKMGLSYLQKSGVPDLVISAINRSATTKNTERAVMRPVCFAAAEMLDHFDNEKWEKLSPGKQLPPKSALRFLQINPTAYLRLFERATEFLYLEKAAQERTSIEDLGRPDLNAPVVEAPPISTKPSASAEVKLESELEDLIESVPPPPPLARPGGARVAPPPVRKGAPTARSPRTESDDAEISPAKREEMIQRSYDLGPKDPSEMMARRKQVAPLVTPPPLRTSSGNAFVSNLTGQIENAKRAEDLLRDILDILINEGPFEKTALIVVSKDRKTAIVVAARGPEIATGQQLLLDDPLSPLAQCFSKVQSFGNRAHPESPWGSKAFALSPVDANHETPVALYADCGVHGAITFEARRIFRVVVDILNQKLPTIPGGLPVEL